MNQKELEQKARKYAKKIVKLPFVQMVALTGSVAMGIANKQSDIDFFIQIKKGRIYIGRLIVTLIVHLWGQRRTDKNIAGKLCLNWFATSNLPKERHFTHKVLASNPLQSTGSGGWVLDLIESITKKYQISRFKKDPRTYAKGSEVRWSDSEIGLHPPKF